MRRVVVRVIFDRLGAAVAVTADVGTPLVRDPGLQVRWEDEGVTVPGVYLPQSDLIRFKLPPLRPRQHVQLRFSFRDAACTHSWILVREQGTTQGCACEEALELVPHASQWYLFPTDFAHRLLLIVPLPRVIQDHVIDVDVKTSLSKGSNTVSLQLFTETTLEATYEVVNPCGANVTDDVNVVFHGGLNHLWWTPYRTGTYTVRLPPPSGYRYALVKPQPGIAASQRLGDHPHGSVDEQNGTVVVAVMVHTLPHIARNTHELLKRKREDSTQAERRHLLVAPVLTPLTPAPPSLQ